MKITISQEASDTKAQSMHAQKDGFPSTIKKLKLSSLDTL